VVSISTRAHFRFDLKTKLTFLLFLTISCAGGFLALLLSGGPGGLPVVAAFIVPGARQLVTTSSHPLVRYLSEPQIAAVTPDGCDMDPKVYVSNLRSDSVSVIDAKTDSVIATIPVGRNPFAIAITPDCSKAYVGNSGNLFIPENSVSVIDVKMDTAIDVNPATPEIDPITVGLNPGAMAITPDGSKLYVANFGSEDVPDNTVSVIDVETDSVIDVNPQTPEIDPITVGLRPGALAITSDGSRVYVTNSFDSTFTVINTATDAVIDTITNTIRVGQQDDPQFKPAGIAIAGSRGYVANSDSDTVSVIDLSKNEVVAAIDVGTRPLVVATTPDGSKVYVTNLLSNNVSVIDVQKSVNDPGGAVIATIPVGNIPIGIGITPNGLKAYVGNCNCGVADPVNPDTVSVIDVATNSVIAEVEVGFGPLGLAITPDGSKVYVPNSNSSTVSVIDVATDTAIDTNPATPGVIDPIPVGSGPADIVITPDDTKAYVSNFNNPDSPGNTVSVIDTELGTVVGEITVGLGPAGMAITPDGSKLYVANFGSIREPGNSVSVIDVENEKVIDEITVGTGPIDIAVSPDGFRAYVVNFGSKNLLGSTVSVINVSTDTVISTVTVGAGPAGIAVAPDGSKVYVANLGGVDDPPGSQASNTVSVIDTAMNTVIATVNLECENADSGKIPCGPIGIEITPDGSQAYVANFGRIKSQNDFDAGNTVSVIDLMNNTATQVPIGSGSERFGPAGIAITPGDVSGIYVSNLDRVSEGFGAIGVISVSDPGDTVLVIDRDGNNIVDTIGVGNRPFGIDATHDGARVYVANYFGNTVSVVDTSTNTVIATIPIKTKKEL